jgi:hypothetical protein
MMDKVISGKWYKDKNVIKFTRTKISSNLWGQKCPQNYEDKNTIKITRTKMSSNYKDQDILKFTRTKMSSNLQGQRCPQITRTIVSSKL